MCPSTAGHLSLSHCSVLYVNTRVTEPTRTLAYVTTDRHLAHHAAILWRTTLPQTVDEDKVRLLFPTAQPRWKRVRLNYGLRCVIGGKRAVICAYLSEVKGCRHNSSIRNWVLQITPPWNRLYSLLEVTYCLTSLHSQYTEGNISKRVKNSESGEPPYSM